MPNLIPMPKTYETLAEGVHFVPFHFFCEKEEWQEHAAVFCDAFERGHAWKLSEGEKGGIEVYFDASVAKNAYRITTEGPLCLYASEIEGLMYGFATALQLCTMADVAIRLPSVKIEDYPDKDYRSIMVDIGREWHPFDKLMRFVDLCFLYKVRYLNLHFADNKLYTLPSKAFPKLNVKGKYYTEEDIATLRAYAKARGVVLVPEFECPGHAPVLNTYYPEVFADRAEGAEPGPAYNESGDLIPPKALVCAGSDRAVEGVKTLLREICELFPEAPYVHIGGDEASIYLWNQCADCREYMKKNGIEDVYGLYSDYVGRIASYVLSLGKTPIVWEGFPEKGHEKIPRETIVISWENHYQTTEQLLAEGFTLINASWKPLYIIPSLIMPAGEVYWNPRDIYDWNVYNWQHWWPNSKATLNPVHIQPTEQVIGAMLCAWEMTYEQEISTIMAHLPVLADRCWSVKCTRTFEEYAAVFRPIHNLTARIIQDR